MIIGGETNNDRMKQSRHNQIALNPWGPTSGSPLKKRIVEGNIEILKLKKTSSATRAIAFTRNINQEDYLPFILDVQNGKSNWNWIKSKGWKDAKELPFSVIRGSVVASPDGKYAIIVPGISKESSEKQKNVYLLNIKTLKIEVVRRENERDGIQSGPMSWTYMTDGTSLTPEY